MGVQRVRRLGDFVEGKIDTLARAFAADRIAHRAGARAVAELGLEVGTPVDALARDGGIEPVGPPEDLRLNVGPHRQRPVDAALADKAPGTHSVGDDVDLHDANLASPPAGREGV